MGIQVRAGEVTSLGTIHLQPTEEVEPQRIRFDLMQYYRDNWGTPDVMDDASLIKLKEDNMTGTTPPGFDSPPHENEVTAAYYEFQNYPIRDAILTYYRDNYGEPGKMDALSVTEAIDQYAWQVIVPGFEYPITWQELNAIIDEWYGEPNNDVPEAALAVEQLFIGTTRWGFQNPDYGPYIMLKNHGTAEVSGRIQLIDWQDQLGERGWSKKSFTIAPDGVGRFSWKHSLLEDQLAYVRFVIEVDDVIVLETPEFYFTPGKIHSNQEAAGACEYSAPGFAMLWYSQKSETERWGGFYRTPPPMEGDEIHGRSIPECRTGQFDGRSWGGVFLAIFDPDFISGARYWAEVWGGPAYRQAWFEWTQV